LRVERASIKAVGDQVAIVQQDFRRRDRHPAVGHQGRIRGGFAAPRPACPRPGPARPAPRLRESPAAGAMPGSRRCSAAAGAAPRCAVPA
jgi:hypothetical protein